jgi:hypothetical protein
MNCPRCNKLLDPARHGALVFDGQVWCDQCHLYERRLIRPRDFEEMQEWGQKICQAFNYPVFAIEAGQERPVNPSPFPDDTPLLMAEADHRQGCIILYPPGCRLTTLCHEIAHLATGQDHTEEWALTFARLVAWVKAQLPPDQDTAGIYVNLLK